MFEKIIISPDVSLESVIKHVENQRASGNEGNFILRTLENKSPRKEIAKLAKKVGYREIIPTGLFSDDYKNEFNSSFGKGHWFYRYDHDEFANVYYPSKKWLSKTFGTHDLDELMEADSPAISWDQRVLYSYPSNPEEWGVDIPIDCKKLNVAQINFERACPNCGHIYSSKRQDLCQCPECIYVDKPFETIDEAFTPIDVDLNYECVGRCPRCSVTTGIVANIIEQCGYCGQMLRGKTSKKSQKLNNNQKHIEELLKIKRNLVIKNSSDALRRYKTKTWSIDIPHCWQIEDDDEYTLIYKPGSTEKFQLVTYVKEDENLTYDDLHSISEIECSETIKFEYVQGIFKKHKENGDIVFDWWLFKEKHLFHIRYACDISNESIGLNESNKILKTLRSLK